ncbi:DUF6233 domain-containing protein [Streptomyces sp. NPDC058637]|uniref:DUF6233 domain-containing protein n=1 Tax=Streptomyces sp. NPDC058637 TaxID=3346569 RepID=UPI00365F6077
MSPDAAVRDARRYEAAPPPDDNLREPTPLEKYKALAQWLEFQLRQVRGRIRDLEAQEHQERGRRKPQPEESAGPGRREVEEKPQPRPPDWGISEAGPGSVVEVHRGDCWAARKELRAISRERALAELADGAPACEVCRPDRPLGVA